PPYSSHHYLPPLLPCLFRADAPPPSHISTLSLHDALPISHPHGGDGRDRAGDWLLRQSDQAPQPSEEESAVPPRAVGPDHTGHRSEEHTSELQSRFDLVCRLLLEKKKI